MDPTDLMLSVMEVTRRSLMEQICSTSQGLKVNSAKRICSSHRQMKKKRIKRKGKRKRVRTSKPCKSQRCPS